VWKKGSETMAHDPSPTRKLFVYNEETMIRFMDLYWDFFEDATLVPDKTDPYWVVTMKRPRRRAELAEVRTNPDIDLPLTFTKQDQKKKPE
jgi:hypothetical protein